MKSVWMSFALVLGICSHAVAESDAAPVEILRYGVVNDRVVDAVAPGGLVQTQSGDLLVTFVDKGDSAAGSKCYFVRSKDRGKTWSQPYMVVKPKNPKEGTYTEMVSLPDGNILLMIIRILHVDESAKSVFNVRESTIELQVSRDNGESFQPLGFFDTPRLSLTSTMGALYQLKNGDLIVPAYCYSGHPIQTGEKKYHYGSGFFRSVDGGKHWGPLELVFDDPPSAQEERQQFNESAFVVRDDGVTIAYARVDVHRGVDYKNNKMWRCQSSDHGLTWTKPVETEIAGIYPVITKLPSGQFVMSCGVRDSKVFRRTTSLFTSHDGIAWKYRGHPYYSRNKGLPFNSATGGSQALLSMGENKLYVVFYACDPTLPGHNKTYIDGCLLKLK